jgi:transcriptional regulator with XRE-family HTH domain
VDPVQPNFGIRIRKLRLDKGFSQFDLAELCGISEDHVSKIDRGESWASKEVIERLARAFAVSQRALFDYRENDAFVKSGGLARRAGRKAAKLVVRHKKNVDVRMPPKR